MASKVSFIILLKDKFGPVARKVDDRFQSMERNAEKLNRRLGKTTKRFDNLAKLGKRTAAVGAVATAAITAPILLIGRSMVNAASDAVETANKFNSVFDDVEDKANQVANSFSKNFGTAGSTARKLIGDTGDLLVGFGFSGDAALELSRKVNELAADLTSFQNVQGGVPRASEALTKALLGETESAKSLGIVIRQNTPEFRKQVKTIARAKRITEQQAKAIVILDMATRQSRKAIGDTARTWEDYASVVRRNEEATKELKEAFGRELIPVATKLTAGITKLVRWLTNLSPVWKTIIVAVSGFLAIGGPLLILLGGIALAVSVISLPVLLVGAAILGLGVIIAAVALNWKSITATMGGVWDSFLTNAKAGLVFFANLAIRTLNTLLAPINLVAEALGFDGIRIPEIKTTETRTTNAVTAPTTPVGGAGGTLNGQITVAAAQGSVIKQAALQTAGQGLNIGMNVPAGAQ